jgi:GT2 family glycosyltransferase
VRPASVLIVNYNGGAHLAACLAALEEQTLPREQFEVIVLDNNSHDHSADVVPVRFPWATLLRSSVNLGFAEGNNVAASQASHETLVLLNNDTIPDPFWLEELLLTVEEHPGCAVASKLVFADRPTVVNSAGLYLLRDGRGADRGFEQPDDGRYETGGPIFAGCGAAVALPRDDFGKLFDPRYFLYSEDLDAGWRHQLNGLSAVLAPRSLVRHVHGAAAGSASPVVRFHVERNRALAGLRNGDYFLALWCAFVLLAKVPQAFLCAATGRLPFRHAFAIGRAFASYLSLLPETLAKRYVTRFDPPRRVRCAS